MLVLFCLILVFLFYALAKICDEYFVESLESITKRFKISDDVAGATFMAIGSSAPEFFTAVMALTKVGAESIGAGTIVGSAIFNVLVIIGASALVSKTMLSWRPITRDIIVYMLAILFLLFTFADGVITFGEASTYLGFYVAYLLLLKYWKYFVPERTNLQPLKIVKESWQEIEEHIQKSTHRSFLQEFDRSCTRLLGYLLPNLKKYPQKYLLTFGLSVVYIAILSWMLVEVAVALAEMLNISKAIIALTVLAIGTSIPDLLSSIFASRKGQGDMAVSNALGSNTFDIMIGLGLPWWIYILLKDQTISVSRENLSSSIMLLFSSVLALMVLLLMQRYTLGKKSGFFLIGAYLLYLVFAIIKALHPEWVEAAWMQISSVLPQ